MTQTFWRKQTAELGAAATLVAWRWRQQWLLWLLTGLGVLSAVTLICALPLFSAAMITAGLRTTLRSSPDNTRIEARLGLTAISTQALNAATGQLSARFTQDLASYAQTTGDLSTQVEVSNWFLAGSTTKVILRGAPMSTAANHVQVLQGTLPAEKIIARNGDSVTLDVALTRSAATYLHVQIGSLIPLSGLVLTPDSIDGTSQIASQSLTLRVVGIFQTLAGDPYWHSLTFEEPAPIPHATPAPFHMLIASQPFLQWADALAQQYGVKGLAFGPSVACFLTYNLLPEHVSSATLNDLVVRLQQLQADLAHMQSGSTEFEATGTFFPYIGGVDVSGAALEDPAGPELLETFQNEVLLGQSTLLILLILSAGLLLFFVSILAQTQIERQAPALALLRSRGASRLQILATFCLQSLLLCLLAACLAPALALALVRWLAPLFLPPAGLDALAVLPSSFAALFSSLEIYILSALLVVLGAQMLAFIFALRGTVLTWRRELARSTRRPLWLRLRLDLALTILALVDYGFSFYAQSTEQLLDARSRLLLLTPLSLLAPLLLLLAGMFFFLRLFPALLRFLLRLVSRRRDASSLLAVAQVARAPRQPLRLTLLLSLALAFAIFTLIFASSQIQNAQDLATYQAGADFSGYLPLNLQAASLANRAHIPALYSAIPGVTATAPGYRGQAFLRVNPGSPSEFFRPLQIQAVEPQSFAQTATWTPQTSTQSLSSLLSQLVALRPQALQRNVVPALLSASAWQILNVRPGTVFHVFTTDGARDPISYLAVAASAHIPPVNENIASGMLVDFQALQAAYQHQKETLPYNYIWLQTNSQASVLARTRQTLSTAPLALSNLADRRALTQVSTANPLILNILITLSIGVSTALLLALVANLLLPALNLRLRLTSFAFLRALGAAPAQVMRLLLWEQCIVLGAALLLGTLAGFPLAALTVPALITNSPPATGMAPGGANGVYLLQGVLPVRLVLPPTLLLALLILLVTCALALLLLSRMTFRLTLSQYLRLNED